MKRRFQLVLIKPSHYHDDGYVIRWWRALIPSNSLASVYGLALDCAQAAGARRGRRDRYRRDRRDQYPRQHPQADPPLPRATAISACWRWWACSRTSIRARSISRGTFRAAGIPVALGGFHVSGCLSMLDGKAIDLELARDLGISIFAGEAEGRLEPSCRTPRRAA